jgi:Putative prokaryotic signal transducing protein
MTQRQVVVESFENEIDAEIAKARLEAENIEANIVKDDAGGMFPSLQQTSGVRLLVPEDSADRAKEILGDESLPEA